MDVGVRELKEHLSEYLERAANGESIRVTDRGKPKAMLVPLPGVERDRGVEEGWVRPGRKASPVAVPRFPASRRVLEALDEDRGR